MKESYEEFSKRVGRREEDIVNNTELGPNGYKLRNIMAEAGFEVTPDELHQTLAEAAARIGHGKCEFCGAENKELRYGMCFNCFINDEGKEAEDGEEDKSKRS